MSTTFCLLREIISQSQHQHPHSGNRTGERIPQLPKIYVKPKCSTKTAEKPLKVEAPPKRPQWPKEPSQTWKFPWPKNTQSGEYPCSQKCRTFELMFTIFSVTRRSRSDVSQSVSQWVSESLTLRTELTDVTLVSEDTYWRLYWETLIINDTYWGDVREIVGLIMEVDKVVDEVTDMEIDK